MLGDSRHHKPDIQASIPILEICDKFISGYNSVISMAAGKGREAKSLFIKRFKNVDLEDINAEFLEKAKKLCKTARHFYNVSI